MPPRQRALPTDFDSRLARIVAAEGRIARGGMSRIGPQRRGGLGGQSVLTNVGGDSAETTGAAQLLVLSATGVDIAAGGDFVAFDSIVAQHGFDGVVQALGGYWVHPVSGVYLLTYEHVWATYSGGGTIQLQVDEADVPGGLIAWATSGGDGSKTISYFAAAGSTGRVWIDSGSDDPETCSARLWVAITDPTTPAAAAGPDAGELLETIWVDSRNGAGATSTRILESGQPYTLVVTGNWRESDDGIPHGDPDDILFVSSGQPAQLAAADAEVAYGLAAPGDPFHRSVFLVDLGSGYAHPEPVGGAVSSPTVGHTYTYSVTGEGLTLTAVISDSAYSDNNGQLKVEIFSGDA